MKKIFLLTILSFLTSNLLKAQGGYTDMWVKIVPELQFKLPSSKLDLRFVPDHHTFTPNSYIPDGQIGTSEFLVGYPFWKFKAFSYTKVNFKGAFWTGARLDFATALLDKKVILSLQERFFLGLNDKSKDHFFFIQYLGYKIPNNKMLGVLSLGKWDIGQDMDKGVWAIGPAIKVHDQKNFGMQVALMKDVFNEHLWITFVSLVYKIDFSK